MCDVRCWKTEKGGLGDEQIKYISILHIIMKNSVFVLLKSSNTKHLMHGWA